MPPKPNPKAKGQPSKGKQQQQQKGATDSTNEERAQESSQAAQTALSAQREATRLTQAAAGAGDPNERQHLLNEALNKEIESESFGKTAKYLQSGTFQGMLAGGGMGTIPGVTLGTLTGTLVGGVSSLVTGGLGSAIGAGVGAVHGSFFKLGDFAGEGIRKVTGDLPGWAATDEQKGTLETMIGQVNEQDRPSEKDLEGMTSGAGVQVQSAAKGAAGSGAGGGEGGSSWLPGNESLPSMPTWAGGSGGQAEQNGQDQQGGKRPAAGKGNVTQAREKQKPSSSKAAPGSKRPTDRVAPQNKSRKSSTTSSVQTGAYTRSQSQTRAKPVPQANGQNPAIRSAGQGASRTITNGANKPPIEKKKPKKLEMRGQSQPKAPAQSSAPSQPKKAPRKLDNRSKK